MSDESGRMEAFSDGVIAIVITITVLELRGPHGSDLTALTPLVPVFEKELNEKEKIHSRIAVGT
jgi:uncharacterized membrane protein